MLDLIQRLAGNFEPDFLALAFLALCHNLNAPSGVVEAGFVGGPLEEAGSFQVSDEAGVVAQFGLVSVLFAAAQGFQHYI